MAMPPSITADGPPRFTIDLSLPPEQRYLEVCAAFRDEMIGLTALFDEVVGDMVSFIPLKWLHRLCRFFLQRVYSDEENAELRGISKTVGVSVYLLVCFNVLLDLFMGCSSGGAAVRAGRSARSGSKMLHFRTLDWGMDELRRIVVHLDFVRDRNGPVVASSVTYAGFVGVLTGVRQGLSISLNFRPSRIDNGDFWADRKYAWHLLMVLLGRRPSISSELRRFLLSPRPKSSSPQSDKDKAAGNTLSYDEVIAELTADGDQAQPITTTACYLCICNGQETTVIEKDRISATSRSSTDFIVVTNTDAEAEQPMNEKREASTLRDPNLQELINEARDRQECACRNWSNMCFEKLRPRSRFGSVVSQTSPERRAMMQVADVVELVQTFPTTNESSHFACVMDPSEGKVEWCRRWIRPVDNDWVRDHFPTVP